VPPQKGVSNICYCSSRQRQAALAAAAAKLKGFLAKSGMPARQFYKMVADAFTAACMSRQRQAALAAAAAKLKGFLAKSGMPA